MQLDNSEISAVTGRTPETAIESATIDIIGLDLLRLENNSLISARAETGANGGNINITGENGFIIALPLNNSDIIATADDGAGGEINISVDQLFGLTLQDSSIDLRNNRTNDISASSASGPQGIVTLDILNIDPTQGLVELPATFADSPSFDAVCNAAVRGGNEFTITGRGGLPAAPTALANNLDPWEDWFMLNPNEPLSFPTARDSNLSESQLSANSNNNVKNVTEAQGWQVADDGTILLLEDNVDPLIPADEVLQTLSCWRFQSPLN